MTRSDRGLGAGSATTSTGQALAIALVPALGLLAIVAIVAVAGDLDTGAIFRDPSQLYGYDPLAGTISALGIILWWVTAGICAFAFTLARRLDLEPRIRLFLLTSALLTALLAIDDQFLIHDELAKKYLGLRERHVVAAYVGILALWLLVNARVIRRSKWPVLAVSLGLFATSVAADSVIQTSADVSTIGVGLDWSLFAEDGFKFMGIAAWTTYLVSLAFGTIAGARYVAEPAR